LIDRSRIPVVTLTLIVANLFASFAVAFNGDLVLDWGFNPRDPTLANIPTSLFLHQNLLHLLGNMVFLAAVGAAVELATGSVRFLLVYLVSGFIGVLAHFLFTVGQREPAILIGASGSIAGCAAYYSVRYIGLKVPVAPRRGLSVAVVTAIWLTLQFVGAFVSIGTSASVSFWAHIGGFLGGLLLSLAFRAPDLGQRKLGHEVLDRMNERGPAAVALAARRHLLEHPGDVRALRDLADAERQLAHTDSEIEALQMLIKLQPPEEQGDVLVRLGELNKLDTISSVRRIQLADHLGTDRPEVSRLLLESILDGPASDQQIPEAMLSLAALERMHEPERASQILEDLRAKFPLHATVEVARHRGWIS
jgi:membrane associated rhomboid family serine protease